MNLLQTIQRLFQQTSFAAQNEALQQPLLNERECLELVKFAETKSNQFNDTWETAHKLFGEVRSTERGAGLDYEESRPYQPGDDMRSMNWRLTARTGELFVKIFREPRKPGVFLLIDRRPNMRFGTTRRLKVTQAVRVATVLAHQARLNQTPVGGLILENPLRWIPQQSGANGFFDLINNARTPCPPCPRNSQPLSLEHTLRLLAAALTKGTLIYLISDFSDLNDAVKPVLFQLQSQHQVHCIQINDPGECELPVAGMLPVFDTSTSEPVLVNTSDRSLRTAFKQDAEEWLQHCQNFLLATSGSYHLVNTASDSFEAHMSIM